MADVLQKSAEPYEPRGRLDPGGFARHIQFCTYAPPADLAPFVEHGWAIRWDAAVGSYDSEEVMHRPYVDVFISAQQSGVQGTFCGRRTYRAAGSGRIVGVRLRPAAFHAFWGGAVATVQEKVVDIQQVFPHADAHAIAQLLTRDDQGAVEGLFQLLRDRAPQPDATIELVNKIIRAIEAEQDLRTVREVAGAFARSERWLQQLFRSYIGVGLKWLLQRHRLLQALQQIRATDQPDWAAIAYDLGYSSQQHFITACRQVVGKTPVQYKNGLAKAASARDPDK